MEEETKEKCYKIMALKKIPELKALSFAFLCFLAILGAILFPGKIFADAFGNSRNFNIDRIYDSRNRTELSATLQYAGQDLYFYTDDQWWNGLSGEERQKTNSSFQNLSDEFSNVIYPKLTAVFGSEAKPGIDNDSKITVLVHPMANEAGGYFNTADGYEKTLTPNSNEREMLYINSKAIAKPYVKMYLAHEFVHLITFNQKDKLRGIEEENWLNEARADYSSTLLGYDDQLENNNLKQRIQQFLDHPNDSLTEWLNSQADYGVIHLFTQYLVDQYGIKILSDSLQSEKVGIPSLNGILQKNGYPEDFYNIFNDWLIATLVNDCSLGEKYCYRNKNLKDFKVIPKINYLPPSSEVTLSVTYSTTYFSGNWQKITGGKGDLTFEFIGDSRVDFSIPYLLCDPTNVCFVKNLKLNSDKKGNINIPSFGTEYLSFTLMPYIKGKISGFDGTEDDFSYSFRVDVSQKKENSGQNTNADEKKGKTGNEEKNIAQLTAQIERLKKEIARLLAELKNINSAKTSSISCKSLGKNLFYGMQDDNQVRCLQEFLKNQGKAIYPEGIISGNFFSATKLAVIRFQEKNSETILIPAGLKKGTGYVGELTRKAINALISKSI